MPLLHHRSHERLREYWDNLKRSRAFPSEGDIDSEAIADIWPFCFLISIDEVTRRLGYRYSYLGDNLLEAYGYDAADPDVVLRLLSTGNTSTIHKLDEVIKLRTPVIDESEFVNAKHCNVKYRSCMLPLGYNDQEVSHIIGSMSWRVY